MARGAEWRVVRRGASHGFDRHEPSTFLNGAFLFLTIVVAFLVAEHVDEVGWYMLFATFWIFRIYWEMCALLGHVMELEEKLAEPHDSLEAMRTHATVLPILGLLPFLAVMALT